MSKIPKIYRLGILGLGEGRSVISAAQKSPRWEIANICDLNEELCKKRCQEFGLTVYTTLYQDMLDDPDIDVIGIYTPDQLHALHIKMALEAGKDVICTKPLMLSLDKADELLKIAKRAKRHVFIGQSSRYFEPARRQHADFEAGKLGELVTLETHYISDSRWFLERSWSRTKGFSWMYNFMIHAVDLAAWYLPQIEDVYGVGVVSQNTKDYSLSVPDTMKFILKDKNGICATISGIYAAPTLGYEVEQSISCTLRGTKGICRAGYPRLEYFTNFEPVAETSLLHDYSDLHNYYFRFEGLTHHAGEYQNYLEHFAAAMDKDEIPKPDLKEGIRTLAIMSAMDESMKTGTVVKVSDILKKYSLFLNE